MMLSIPLNHRRLRVPVPLLTLSLALATGRASIDRNRSRIRACPAISEPTTGQAGGCAE